MPDITDEQQLLRLMFISRGHGRGHAIPDIAIANRLRALSENVVVEFVSYAAGAETFRSCGYPVIDLGMSDDPVLWDSCFAFVRLLTNHRPAMLVAHEEIAALPIASALNIPTLFITDFFMDPNTLPMQTLQYAKEIIFTADRGIFTEPPTLTGKVRYVGRAVRDFGYTRDDKERARRELEIPDEAVVVLCQPGAWREAQVPVADLVRAAWALLPSPKYLVWLAGRDVEKVTALFDGDGDVRVLREDWKIDRLMSASDVLITKANRMSVYEAAAIGLATISLSNSANWPDDVAVAKVESNIPLWLGSLRPEDLAQTIIKHAKSEPQPATAASGGVDGAARRIAHHVDLLRR